MAGAWRERLDQALVARGLARSDEGAATLTATYRRA